MELRMGCQTHNSLIFNSVVSLMRAFTHPGVGECTMSALNHTAHGATGIVRAFRMVTMMFLELILAGELALQRDLELLRGRGRPSCRNACGIGITD